MKRSLVLLLALAACGDDDLSDSQPAKPDGGVDAGTLDGGRDAALDAWVAASTACAADNVFQATHSACATDEDCVIAGSCSGGWGFRAVQTSARSEAQAQSDNTLCKFFDGPMFDAVCEQARCVARATGHWCGEPAEAGVVRCVQGEQLYATEVDGGALSCRKRCAGADDTSCSCEQTPVHSPDRPYGTGTSGDFVEVWLCR